MVMFIISEPVLKLSSITVMEAILSALKYFPFAALLLSKVTVTCGAVLSTTNSLVHTESPYSGTHFFPKMSVNPKV